MNDEEVLYLRMVLAAFAAFALVLAYASNVAPKDGN